MGSVFAGVSATDFINEVSVEIINIFYPDISVLYCTTLNFLDV